MKHEDKLPENIGLGVIAGLIAAIAIFVICAWLLWQIPYPEKLTDLKAHLRYWTALHINEIAPPLFQSTADSYRNYIDRLGSSAWQVVWRLNIAAFFAILSGAYISYLVGRRKVAVNQIGGRELLHNIEAKNSLKLQAKKECGNDDDGIKLHSSFDWSISRSRECQHIIILGKSGSGKTQIIIPMICASINRGDQLVIYDNKGDFSRWIDNAIQIAPWHKDSMAIDIAKDCTNTQSARELAARLIPSGTDPMWHQAARLVLVAILIKLQKEKPGKWSWGDLYTHICKDQADLLSIIKEHTPEARHVIEAPGKTTQSILVNFSVNMTLIADLAAAWGNAPEDKRISITEWIKNPPSDKKILILQGAENYKELSNAYIHIVLDMMSSLINSPELTESTNRRIYFFIDEFIQLGKIDKFRALLEIGRSKGVRVVMAFHDISQLKDVYGEHIANTWLGIVGTYIVTQLGISETSNYVAEKMVGYKTIDRIVMRKDQPDAPIRERVLVIEPHELNENLGKSSKGINALILGYKNAHIIEWPFSNVENVRLAYVPAAWLSHAEYKQSAIQDTSSTMVKVDDRAIAGAFNGDQNKKLKLRKLTQDEIVVMAESGTNMSNAAEPIDAMSDSSIGGYDEPR
jgi:hypothetical protein